MTEAESPLKRLFDPSSVSIVGASADPAKWGHSLAIEALGGAERRRIYLVNRNGGHILGRQTYRSQAHLPEVPEAVFLSIPAASFEREVDTALELGSKLLVGITAGLGEAGPTGKALERDIVRRIRRHDARLIGPNCLGVFDAGANLSVGMSGVPKGHTGLISQSGNLVLEMAKLAKARRLWFLPCCVGG